MQGFAYGLLAFLAALAIYAVFVRVWRPAASTRLLGPVLFTSSFIVILVLCLVDRSPGILGEGILAVALASSLIVAYAMANTAIETDSPTQSFILFLASHHSAGVTGGMIDRFICEHPFRNSRLEGLIEDGLIERRNNRLVCRAGGRLMLDATDAYRRFIRRTDVAG